VTLDRLRNMGCDLAQGYHLSKPLIAADVVTWIRSIARVRAAQEPAEIRRIG
jgi:EAL domain-containing protein (putative c-di-GMP-specific phosphodiesterase class I)